MAVPQILIGIISLVIGYFLGSINPAYIFGRINNIDIRKKGTLNAGTTNVYHILGASYAIPTAFYDVLKGLISMYIAFLLGASFIFIQVSGFAAMVGHIFPFYLKFKGGQGVATATGMVLYYLVKYILLGWTFLYIIFYLAGLVLIFFYVSRVGEVQNLIILPMLAYMIFMNYPGNPYNIFFAILLTYMALIGLRNIIVHKKIKIEDETFRSHWWRVAARPLAAIFLIVYILSTKNTTLIFVGVVAIIFIILDLVRFFHKQTNEYLTVQVKKLFKKGEEKKFSSMTIFLVATFISILLFEKNIAIAAVTFLIFGDIFGKIFGLAFGRHKFLHKSLEGILANYGSVMISGYILFTLLNMPLLVLLIGGLCAPLIEGFSTFIDDNFTVPIISGVIMTVVALFL